jgi:glycosyltransferase involved in cell wall biosynthesis
MKILMVGDYQNDPRLGSTKVYHKLREEFIALGHTCDVLLDDALGTPRLNTYARQALSPTFAARAVSRAFRRFGQYDVIDVASAEGFILGLQKRLGAYRHTALINRSHGLEHLNYRRMLDDHDAGLLHKPWSRRLWFPAVRLSQVAGAARLADRFIVLNAGDRQYALDQRWKTPEKIDLIAHGISSRFLSVEGEPSVMRGAGMLFCGSWTGVKGVHYLAAAFSQLADRNTGVPLTVLGGGVSEADIRAAFSPAAQPFLTVIARADETEVIRQYRHHDALVFTSTYEGFGMVLLEAMSQGLPVITTPVGCASLLVQDGENGLLVPSRDAAALAGAIRALSGQDDLRRKLSLQARESAKSFTWQRTALQTVTSYQQAWENLRH